LIENATARAKTLLADDFFQGVVKKQRELYISNILNSAEEDVDLRERTLLKLRALEEFISSLESIAKDGEIKDKRLKIF
jgi:hypothetical protein